MKILLAVDDSKFSKAAAQAVLTQFKPQGTSVRVLTVTHVVMNLRTNTAAEGYYGKMYAAFQEESARSKALVARTAALLSAKGFKVTASVEGGDPRDKILDVAAKWRADLIVVGSHGRSGLKRFLMGSVSEAIVRQAHCSVQVVRRAPAS